MSSYAIDSESDQFVVVTLTGQVRFDTIIALLDELEGLARGRRDLAVLVDETEASPGLVGGSEIRRMVEHWRRATTLKRGRLAIVAPGLAMYGVNRMAQGRRRRCRRTHRRLQSRAAATKWLFDVDPPAY
jgi:hypothetical protein